MTKTVSHITKISPFRSGKIYVLPTKFGVAYSCGLFAMFLAAASYGNNLVYLLTFIVFSIMIASLISTNFNLKGISVASVEVISNHVNDELEFVVYLASDSKETKYGLLVNIRADGITRGMSEYVGSLSQNEQKPIIVKAIGTRRGMHRLNRVLIESVYPIGLWRSWSYINEDLDFYVFPERAGDQPLPEPMIEVEGDQGSGDGIDDFSEHRNFQQGDSYRHVDWKARARGRPLMVKQFTSGSLGLRLLDWSQVQSNDLEAKLKQLSQWINQCHKLQEPYGLSLPGVSVPPNSGVAQYQRCQAFLAKFGGPYDDAG